MATGVTGALLASRLFKRCATNHAEQQLIDARFARPARQPALRRRAYSANEESRGRRRMLAGDASMPPGLRAQFSEGERAALTVIVGEVKHHGVCDFPIDKIAALAGVGRTTVQNAVRHAKRLGAIRVTARPQRRRKSLPNLVEVISPEWLTWLRRGPRTRPATIQTGFNALFAANSLNATKSTDRPFSVPYRSARDLAPSSFGLWRSAGGGG